ncbi:MAG: DNA alkylation repair protein [Candidatus Moranbacteria bacterium]|nr:DNA alkylation repair protein [Candidatus Moranbacteria bacterium]
MSILKNLLTDLEKLKNPAKAKVLAGFFKTDKGEYGEGDVFWGITVPKQRIVVRKYFQQISFEDLQYLLRQNVHELRFSAVATLVLKYQKGDLKEKERVAKFYLRNSKGINNWDLVDLSAPQILGDYFFAKDKTILYKLAKSKNLWERRIAVLATFWFIKNKDFSDSLKIAEMLLFDKHDLIHKAVGWMLREIGKRDKKVETKFLDKFAKKMPRTALRYAIEKFSKEEREKYLKMC